MRFNPDLGFSLVATVEPAADYGHQRVSIPIWVSPSSRPHRRRTSPRRRHTFQSRSGFLPRRDIMWLVRGRRRWQGFNPDLGFSLVATRQLSMSSGESGSFNPDLGFSLVATLVRRGWSVPRDAFQSRSGFLPRRDDLSNRVGLHRDLSFNPDLGFSLVATQQIDYCSVTHEVSIPIWVSPSSRPV